MNFVIVGAGATGVETAGALADAIDRLIPARVRDAKLGRAEIHLVDPAPVVLAPFSEHAHEYAQQVLEQRGVQLELGVKVDEVRADRVELSDGREILTRTVVWAGGIKVGRARARSGLPQAPSGGLEIGADLAVPAFPGVYALGDVANTLDARRHAVPAAGIGGAAGRTLRGRQHPRRHRREAPLSRSATATRGSWR